MVRWLIQDSEFNHSLNRNIHPYFQNMLQLRKKGIDHEFWLGISHESFNSFLSLANLSLENMGPVALKVIMREIAKSQLPNELKNQLRRTLFEQKMIDTKVELELLVHINGDSSFILPWDQICSISTKGLEGVYQSIKACWTALFRSGVISAIQAKGINICDIQVSIVLKKSLDEQIYGKAFSYSPRCPWDRRNCVVSYNKGQETYSFLVDRSSFKSTYYGRNIENIDEMNKTSLSTSGNKQSDQQVNFAYDKVRKAAEYLLQCEKLLESSLQVEWVITTDHRIHLKRIQKFDRSPSIQQMAPQFNTSTRNVWDQSLIQWNSIRLLSPLWFSLIPRNFRILSINYIKALGIKNKITSDYEKVFRGFWGILRGRLYINLGALHGFLGLSESHDLAEELEVNVSLWLKRYDRESREAWNLNWPKWPSFSKSDQRTIFNNINRILQNWPEKISNWINQMHSLREVLVSNQWKDKNVASMIQTFQDLEKKYIPSLIPILTAEIQYRNLLSWYYDGAQKPLMNQLIDPSWTQTFEPGGQEIISSIEGNWFVRRSKLKLYKQLETLNQMRPKYLSMLEEVFIKLRKFFEIMGQKYQAMGQIEKSDDLFFLTLEEILAFEEGRAATITWKKLISIRKEEYRRYSNDIKVPETWFTTGLVGLASQYPNVIAIRDRKVEAKIPYNEKFDGKAIVGTFELNKQTNVNSNFEFKLESKEFTNALDFVTNSSTENDINKLDFIEDEKKTETVKTDNSSKESIGGNEVLR